jgi:hypothetical protein
MDIDQAGELASARLVRRYQNQEVTVLGEYDTPECRRPLQEEYVVPVRLAVLICRQHINAPLSDADGIRHEDLDAEVRVLNELIYECQRRLEGIEHARLDVQARGCAQGRRLRE